MFSNIINTPPKRRISLVNKEGSVLPQKIEQQTPLEKMGYKVGSVLGKGEFAKVVQAQSEKHGDVAVKMINKLKADKEYLDKFVHREVQIMTKLKHPHVIQIIESFETETNVYIIMEFAQNGDLNDYINKHGSFKENEAKILFFQIATAMAYCKSENVAHRDLKCANIVLDDENHIKVTDFGFAVNTHGSFLETNCGSPEYAAPEVFPGASKDGYDGHAADVWSMGVILYAMLNAQVPFNEFRIHLHNYRDKVKFVSKVSKDCKNLVRRMLTPDPAMRITIAEILASDWLRKVPKKNPDVLEYSTSQTKVVSDIRLRTQSMQSDKLIMDYDPSSLEDASKRGDSTLVSDVLDAAKLEEERLERRRKLLNAHEPSPLEELLTYKHGRVKYQVDTEEKFIEALKESRAAFAAKMAAEESKEVRRKSVQNNQVKTWKSKYGLLVPPPEWKHIIDAGL